MIEKMGMSDYVNRQIRQLSGGQQQRVFLARALVQEADIYLMDEPFKGVDKTTEHAIISLLQEMKARGKTVIVVHHDLNTVPQYFDWVTMVNKQTVAYGPVVDTFTDEAIERTYGKVERGAFRPQPKPARTSLDDRKYSIQAQKKGPEYLLADGYNLIFAWEELKAVARDNLDAARQMLMEVLSNYQGFKQNIVILVFDAYRVPRSVQDVTKYHNIYVVYTKEAETADTYIERATYEIGRHHRVRVATSDGAEQLIILGHGALRLSASAFKTEVEQVAGQISAILAANNRSAPSQPVAAALERARRRQEDKP